MKRLLIIISAISILSADPSPVGNWKLSGLAVDYLHITRTDATVALSDAYGVGVVVPVSVIPSGVVYQRFTNGPFTLPIIDAAQLNLNVNIYPDGTGAIAEGSFYPDIDLIEGTCITSPQIFPVQDTFVWELGNVSAFATQNILGMSTINSAAGNEAWGFGIAESSTFDGWPANPTPEPLPPVIDYLATTDGTVLAASCQTAVLTQACGELGMAPGADCVGALMGAGVYESVEANIYTCMTSDYATAGQYFGGAGWLHGSHSSGFFNLDQGNSQMGQDLNVDFLLEWNAIDGPTSGSGFGDIVGEDEDGDGTDYDRIFGLPYIPATFTTADCALAPGLDLPIAGDLTGLVAGLVGGLCVDAGGAAEFVYGSCLAEVEAGVEGQCDDAGGPVNAVTGVCYDASQSPEFAGACAAYGAAGALVATCLQLGFAEETCNEAATQAAPAVDAYCVYATGFDCATAGIDECTVLTNPDFSLGLCGTLAGALTTSETCEEWAASFDDDFLNNTATQVLGVTCADYALGSTGLAVGSFNTDACAVVGQGAEDACISSIDYANDMYLMDLSLETWGYFLTYNAASVQQYQAAGYSIEDIAANFPGLLVDDSGSTFDPSCYATGETCGGKLVMVYEPLCIPELEARQIVAEFVNLDDLCEASGDVNGDSVVNVVDVVRLVSHILGGDQLGGVGGCQADVNGDGVINVVDAVIIVNSILGGSNHSNDVAKNASIQYADNKISIEADGFVQGVQLSISHCNDFSIELNDNPSLMVSKYETKDNTTNVILISKGIETIKDIANISSSCEITFNDVVFSGHDDEIKGNDVVLSGYTINPAYPNPFNPTTTLSLTLEHAANVSVKIYNVAGQLVEVIANDFYQPSQYAWTWNAGNLASGAYFVTTQVGSDIHTDKIMLLK